MPLPEKSRFDETGLEHAKTVLTVAFGAAVAVALDRWWVYLIAGVFIIALAVMSYVVSTSYGEWRYAAGCADTAREMLDAYRKHGQ